MAIPQKTEQLVLFINKKKQLENAIKNETEESLKRRIRMLFGIQNEQAKRLDVLEELMADIVHCVLE